MEVGGDSLLWSSFQGTDILDVQNIKSKHSFWNNSACSGKHWRRYLLLLHLQQEMKPAYLAGRTWNRIDDKRNS